MKRKEKKTSKKRKSSWTKYKRFVSSILSGPRRQECATTKITTVDAAVCRVSSRESLNAQERKTLIAVNNPSSATLVPQTIKMNYREKRCCAIQNRILWTIFESTRPLNKNWFHLSGAFIKKLDGIMSSWTVHFVVTSRNVPRSFAWRDSEWLSLLMLLSFLFAVHSLRAHGKTRLVIVLGQKI